MLAYSCHAFKEGGSPWSVGSYPSSGPQGMPRPPPLNAPGKNTQMNQQKNMPYFFFLFCFWKTKRIYRENFCPQFFE